MKTNKQLLIIAPYQFGELSDCYYWAKYTTIFGIKTKYIGYRYQDREIEGRSYPGVKTLSVPHFHNRIILGLAFYLTCVVEILLHNHTNVIICRMPHCEILAKLFKKRNIILDVRTLSVSKDEEIRKRQNLELITIKKLFKTCTVISTGIGDIIGHPYSLLPLGAEPLSKKQKSFDTLNLFYIGTFNGRELSVFINGLARFQQLTGLSSTLDIVGGGTKEEVDNLRSTIIKSNVRGVTLHGYLNHDKARPLFDRCNIGVCFVPITDYYQFQPPTKLYEYLLSGMACIATKTISNSVVINNHNGILINDDEDSVLTGLIDLSTILSSFNSSDIIRSSQCYHWRKVVEDYLLPLL